MNYIDDFGGADTPDRAWDAFFQLGKIIARCGVDEAVEKAAPPGTVMVFLGLEVNTVKMSIKIPEEKMKLINEELNKCVLVKTATLRQTQVLCGLLNFAASCIWPGRVLFF